MFFYYLRKVLCIYRMFAKDKYLYTTQKSSIEEMALSLLNQIPAHLKVLKIVFFCSPKNVKEYISHIQLLKDCVKRLFPTETPLVSYVAQETADNTLTAEVITLKDNSATIKYYNGYVILGSSTATELMTEGIIPKNIGASTFHQTQDIFNRIAQIFKEHDFKADDIYRQWNYIQGITAENEGSQNYQEFNDARSIFYSSAEWRNGYPAATGIGSSQGGVMVDLYAAKSNNDTINKPIDNPLQIAAHNYSQQVLADNRQLKTNNRTTPKFERARIVGDTIYISGTAAIKGEESSASDNILTQTAATMEIMDRLVSPENISTGCKGTQYSFLRIYVKRREDINAVRQYMEEHYPSPRKHYLISDICRPELLIEIEGTATVSY